MRAQTDAHDLPRVLMALDRDAEQCESGPAATLAADAARLLREMAADFQKWSSYADIGIRDQFGNGSVELERLAFARKRWSLR